MERLWAPWRMTYMKGEAGTEQPALPSAQLLAGAEAECFLCQAAGQPSGTELESADRLRLVVRRDTHAVTVLNRYPYNNGHLLIAPRRHVAGLHDLNPEEQAEILQTMTSMTQQLTELMHPDGYNIGLNLGRAAGAGVPGHLHWHVVPRWTGDSNFITVTADSRVISQSLAELWSLLHHEPI